MKTQFPKLPDMQSRTGFALPEGFEPEDNLHMFQLAQEQFDDYVEKFDPNFDLNEAAHWDENAETPTFHPHQQEEAYNSQHQQQAAIRHQPYHSFALPQVALHSSYLLTTLHGHHHWAQAGHHCVAPASYHSLDYPTRQGHPHLKNMRPRRSSRFSESHSSTRFYTSPSEDHTDTAASSPLTSETHSRKDGSVSAPYLVKCDNCKHDVVVPSEMIEQIVADSSRIASVEKNALATSASVESMETFATLSGESVPFVVEKIEDEEPRSMEEGEDEVTCDVASEVGDAGAVVTTSAEDEVKNTGMHTFVKKRMSDNNNNNNVNGSSDLAEANRRCPTPVVAESKICLKFAHQGSCRYGKICRFKHVALSHT